MTNILQTWDCGGEKVIHFEWDVQKSQKNIEKHGLSFAQVLKVFCDPNKVLLADEKHSTGTEKRYHVIGDLGHNQIVTIRVTYRGERIRIIGAGIWRSGYDVYFKRRNVKNEV